MEAQCTPGLFRESSPCLSSPSLTYWCSVALTIWGFGLVWLIIAISSILNVRTRGEKIPFNMGWWGFTFPIGVFTSATLQFGTELDSVAFRVLGTIFTVTLVILWLTVAVGTAVKAWNGVMWVLLSRCVLNG